MDAAIARANLDKALAAHEESRQHVQQAEFAVKLAEIELRRQEELYNNTGKPLAARIDVDKARVSLEDVKSKQEAAKLHAISGEKELKALSEQLKLFTLAAPLAGRLGRLQVVPGQTLSPGTLVTEIVDLDKEIDVLCFVPPHTAGRLRIGQLARIGGIEEPAGNAPRTEGKLQFIADQAEVDTGNVAVKVRFPNTDMHLRGNLTLRVRILTTPGKAALTLPESAVLEDQDPPMVLVVEDHKQEKTKDDKEIETGKARKLRAKLGIHDRVLHLVEILNIDDPEKKWQGSLDTAKFIIEKGQGLSNGDPVRLEVEEDEEPAPEPKP
jgi:RND family efflux transporter MFP subunit